MSLPVADEQDELSLCSIRVGAGLFGIDTRKIGEVLGNAAIQRVPLAAEYISGVVPYRGEVLTAISFRALLGLPPMRGGNRVLVLEDESHGESFGLMVDGVEGVVRVDRRSREANPGCLDAGSQALFDGVYQLPSGLIVQLDPERLRPSHLAECGLFGGLPGRGERVRRLQDAAMRRGQGEQV